MSEKLLFHTSREFICYATEYFHSPTTIALAKLQARHIQLELTPMSSRTHEAADQVIDLLLSPRRAEWHEVKSALHTFAALAAANMESSK